MKILLCADDTDDLTKETSTGAIVQAITQELEEMGGTMEDGISRHQLLLDEHVAYTSHNSAMCVVLDFDQIERQQIIATAERVIREKRAQISDPGLAICWLDQLQNPQTLVDYGFQAKQRVLTKQMAYDLAAADEGLFLEELGGDGSGVIGALAGLGLRLSRCDGTLRGKNGKRFQGQTMTAEDFCQKLKLDCVRDTNGGKLQGDALVHVDEMVKVSFWEGDRMAWARKGEENVYQLCGSHAQTEDCGWSQGRNCPAFKWDNDTEELRDQTTRCCFNCLYRRWLAKGCQCVKGLQGTDQQ